jgi:hypothetical protein
LRRGRKRVGNRPLGKEKEMMVEVISAIGGPCRRLDGKNNSK